MKIIAILKLKLVQNCHCQVYQTQSCEETYLLPPRHLFISHSRFLDLSTEWDWRDFTRWRCVHGMEFGVFVSTIGVGLPRQSSVPWKPRFKPADNIFLSFQEGVKIHPFSLEIWYKIEFVHLLLTSAENWNLQKYLKLCWHIKISLLHL